MGIPFLYFFQHLLIQSAIKYVYVRDAKFPDQYVLLTNTPAEIENLLNDIKWTWHTNLSPLPTGERELEIISDDDNEPSAHNGYIKYFPGSDKIEFDGNVSWLVSLESSPALINLLGH